MNKLSKLILMLPLALAPLAGQAAPKGGSHAALAAGFVAPPDSVQTSVYWYWLSGNVSKEGVVKDLEAMKRAGINRAFIGNIGLGELATPYAPVKLFTDEWWEVTHAALKRASELDIEIGMFNSPGWSQAGGPWIEPGQAMRYLASVKAHVRGGGKVEAELPRPSADFQDVRVVAYPAPAVGRAALTAVDTRVTAAGTAAGAQCLIDGDPATELLFDGSPEAVIDLVTDADLDLRNITVWPARRPIRAEAELQVKGADGYRTIASFGIDRSNPNIEVGFDPYAPVSVSVAKTTGREFRLIVRGAGKDTGFAEVLLSSLPRVERYAEKTFAKMFQSPLPYWEEYQWRDQPVLDDASLAVDPAEVVDITECLDGDRLVWEAPAGEWVVMRTGMRPTGIQNSPAAPEGTGLEVDKMTPAYLQHHFDAFIGEILRRIPAEDRKCWKVVVEDSYETGGQNFTDGFLEAFSNRYGYDPIPFLPVYTGAVVQSEEVSDRFLWDMWRLVADKVAYDYVAGLREVSHKYGLTTWLENYGHWGFPGEFLQYGGQSDEIGGEFWSEGSLGDIENRAASSCGHIYGKNKISAESFTAGGGGYHRYPAMMKQRGDRFFTEGINNTLLHLYISQPYEDREPGVNATFGNEFNRKNTWFPQLDLFIKYVKRVNFMLQQGLNVADAAYFIGEDTPKMTGVTDPALPKGYQFDYINAEVIERDMTVANGLLTLPHGTQYRILVLPKLETMRPQLLDKIARLIEQGAVVLGPAPRRSPSYENYPAADRKVRSTADALWSQIDPAAGYARIGKGMLIDGLTMPQAMELIGCVPDCRTADEDPVLYCHRTVDGMEIYFVSNQSGEPIRTAPEFRVKDMQPEAWNAVDGTMRPLPAFAPTSDGVQVPLKLDGYESLFVVFRRSAAHPETTDIAAGTEVNFPPYKALKTLGGPWTLTFDQSKRGPAEPLAADELFDFTQHPDFDIRHYSGTVVYENRFTLDTLPEGRVYLNLNDVTAMAKVKINGVYVGGVWTPPYRVEITDAIKTGENNVEIDVVTTWKNRLIGDLNLPQDERRTWVAYQPWKADDELQKSGLTGPVVLETNNF